MKDKNDKIEDENDKVLRQVYYDKESPFAFADRKRLFNAVKGKRKSIQNETIDKFLASDRIHSMYRRRPPKTFPKRKLQSPSPWVFLTADLMDISRLSSPANKNMNWIIVCCDLFSRFLFLKAIRRKSAENMTSGMESILNTAPLVAKDVRYLWTDRGREWTCLTKTLLPKYNIKLIFSKNPGKALLSEALIKKTQRYLFRFCDFYNTTNWLQFLDTISFIHNRSKLKALEYHSPLEIVSNKKAIQNLKLANAYKQIAYTKKQGLSPAYNIGDFVRILLPKTVFGKDYLPHYSDEIYSIVHVFPTTPITYSVKPIDGGERALPRHFYGPELSRVMLPQIRDFKDLENEDNSQTKGKTVRANQDQDLYIAETVVPEARTLRSGKTTSNKKSYLIKDRNRPGYQKTITEEQLNDMKKSGKIKE